MKRRTALLWLWAGWRLSGQTRRILRGQLLPLADGSVRLRDDGGREWRGQRLGDLGEMFVDVAGEHVRQQPRVHAELFEAAGVETPPDVFRIDPIHKKAMFVVRGGKPLVITYWCEVCAIRTYSPGKCQCCQEETALDPRDPALEQQSR